MPSSEVGAIQALVEDILSRAYGAQAWALLAGPTQAEKRYDLTVLVGMVRAAGYDIVRVQR